jgi:hypothetical protein
MEILDVLKRLYVAIPEPLEEIDDIDNFFASKDIRRADFRAKVPLKTEYFRREGISSFYLVDLEKIKTSEHEVVFIYKRNGDGNILKPSEGYWRKWDTEEYPVYSAIIHQMRDLLAYSAYYDYRNIFTILINHNGIDYQKVDITMVDNLLKLFNISTKEIKELSSIEKDSYLNVYYLNIIWWNLCDSTLLVLNLYFYELIIEIN